MLVPTVVKPWFAIKTTLWSSVVDFDEEKEDASEDPNETVLTRRFWVSFVWYNGDKS